MTFPYFVSSNVERRSQARRRGLNKTLRHEVITFLGGKCIRCGFTDERALQLDHVDGGGVKELKETYWQYRYEAILKW